MSDTRSSFHAPVPRTDKGDPPDIDQDAPTSQMDRVPAWPDPPDQADRSGSEASSDAPRAPLPPVPPIPHVESSPDDNWSFWERPKNLSAPSAAQPSPDAGPSAAPPSGESQTASRQSDDDAAEPPAGSDASPTGKPPLPRRKPGATRAGAREAGPSLFSPASRQTAGAEPAPPAGSAPGFEDDLGAAPTSAFPTIDPSAGAPRGADPALGGGHPSPTPLPAAPPAAAASTPPSGVDRPGFPAPYASGGGYGTASPMPPAPPTAGGAPAPGLWSLPPAEAVPGSGTGGPGPQGRQHDLGARLDPGIGREAAGPREPNGPQDLAAPRRPAALPDPAGPQDLAGPRRPGGPSEPGPHALVSPYTAPEAIPPAALRQIEAAAPAPAAPQVPPPTQPATPSATPAAPVKKRRRDPFLDNVKFLLIALVIMGHSLVPTLDAHSAKSAYLYIYVFHMPLFVIISGYLSRTFWNSNAKTNKLVDTFLVPYVIVECMFAVLRYALGEKWSLTIIDPAWLNWYLVALLLWRLSTPVWKRMRYPITLSIIVYLLAGLADLPGDFSIDRFFGLMPFFVIGLMLREEHLEMLNRTWVKVAGALTLAGAAVVAILIAPYVKLGPIYYKSGYAELKMSWWMGMGVRVALLVAALAMSAAILALVPRRTTWFSDLGTRTLYAYILHGVVVLTAKKMGWLSQPWLFGPLGVAAIGTCSFALAIILCLPQTRTLFKWMLEPRLGWLYRVSTRPAPGREPAGAASGTGAPSGTGPAGGFGAASATGPASGSGAATGPGVSGAPGAPSTAGAASGMDAPSAIGAPSGVGGGLPRR